MDRGKKSLEDWSKTWEANETHWHIDKPHYSLIKFCDEIISKGSRVFIPLCGKTVDIKWLYDKGFVVHGLEYEENAIVEFFKNFDLNYSKAKLSDDIYVFKTNDSRIQLFQGDFFKFNETLIDDKYDVIWDRASFVAINVDDREKYLKIINNILKKNGKILLSTVNYKPGSMAGPPHYVTSEDVQKYLGEKYEVKFLESKDISQAFPRTPPPISEDCYCLSSKL